MRTTLLLITTLFAASLVACGGHHDHHKHHEHHMKHQAQSQPASQPGSHPHHEEAHPEGAHKHHFTNPEKLAERWNNPERDAWQKPEEVIAAMKLSEGMTVADIGAGTGYFLPHLAKAVGATGKVRALDIEQKMVDYLTQRAEKEGWTTISAHKVQPDGPGQEPASLDRLLTVNTWHHIQNREKYAAKAFEALKPGGLFVIVDYTEDAEPGPPKEYRLAPELVILELQAGGFQAEFISEDLPRQYIVIGRKP